MRPVVVVLGGLAAAFLVAASPARATPVPTGAAAELGREASDIAREAPLAAVEKAHYRHHRYYYRHRPHAFYRGWRGRYGYGPAPGYYGYDGRPRVVCRVRPGFFGLRRKCVERW